MQNLAEDEFVPLACSHNFASEYVIFVAPAFRVIDMTLQGFLIQSGVFIAEHHGRLQNPGSLLLRGMAGTIGILGDKVCGS